ncbi:CpaF family protein [Curvivirga aplysinae]|uniref:CpaF family protein n=1 Tax=Curvivirga aplysinae TaxID=2529852 RepID=UPI001F39AB0B|nr:CpaF family protein [Curvivirga aplysinae]
MSFGKRQNETIETHKTLIDRMGDSFKDKRIVQLKDRSLQRKANERQNEKISIKETVEAQVDCEALTDEDHLVEEVFMLMKKRNTPDGILSHPRQELSHMVGSDLGEVLLQHNQNIDQHLERDLITAAMNMLLSWAQNEAKARNIKTKTGESAIVSETREIVQPILLEQMDLSKALAIPREELAVQVNDIVVDILQDKEININLLEQRQLVTLLINDMLGLGPLEPLLADDSVTDIMVNGAKQVYIEKGGKLVLSEVTFRDDNHVMNVAQRIVSHVGRRVDETSPLCDARLADGSRVNIIIPPLAIDGPSISIRKFSEKKITLDTMRQSGSISDAMATVLKIASRCRLNILISGGTGSGKTTMLNALSRMIDAGERVCTIEDAAELQLQQPHVVRLETRPPNLEGQGEITMRDLMKNTLRMRPDRIILGEIRSGEALDLLQAMNTGHDGSMATIHANNPREAVVRLENMVAMAGVKLPHEAVRAQIAGAVHLVVQVSRMRDGGRRVSQVTEIIGMEGEVVTTQDLFKFEFTGEGADGKLTGEHKSTGLRPAFMQQAEYFGLDKALIQAMGS